MPHSSGGGSHGGGSHGGHGGSHSSSSRTRTSSRPFHNSRRYVYYHRNQPRYFYAGSDFKPGFSFATVFAILIYLPFLWVSISGIIKAVPHIPKYSDHTIIIKDEADVIDDESGVMKELKAFQKKTDITPAVITIYNDDWKNTFSSLEDYAYNRYLSEFNDEMHWLLIYSQPQDKANHSSDWYWEGMQGDNTDSVLRENEAERFNSAFHSYLYDKNDLDESLIRSFSYLTDTISMKPDMHQLGPMLFMLGFVLLHAFLMFYPSFKYRKAQPAPLDTDSNTYGGSDSYGSRNSYGNSYNSTPYSSNNSNININNNVSRNNNPNPLDPQTIRRQRINESGKNYTYSDYKADKKERDAEFNSFIDQYKQMMPENSKDESDMMPSLDSFPATSATYDNATDNSGSTVTCQYCGNIFASKYNKCPFCNARR